MTKKKTLVTPAKKLTPASIVNQKKWGALPVTTKNNLRKTLKDTDKDGVPNNFDCRPKNKRKQEAFLSRDASFLASHHDTKMGKLLGRGTRGDVYEVDGNSDLVVKIANEYDDGSTDEEARLYHHLGMLHKPLFIPTEVRTINGKTAMIRPKITTITDPSTGRVSRDFRNLMPSVLEQIRKHIEDLSNQGFIFADGIQLGFDNAGRPLLYDTGDIRISSNKKEVYHINNIEWIAFLIRARRIHSATTSAIRQGLQQYGSIGVVLPSSIEPITQALIIRNAQKYEYD